MSDSISKIRLDEGCELAYRLDDATDPWNPGPTLLMLHGLAESGESWRAWVPYFARHYRVLRLDLRGYGQSTPMPADYVYRFDKLGRDVIALLDTLKLDRVFVVGGKIGGTLALHVAAHYPERVIAVAAMGAPASLTSFVDRAPGWRKQIREHGVRPWASETMEGRLGSSLSPAAMQWWIDLMSQTVPSTLEGFLTMVPTVDITAELPRVACPTLVVTTTGSGLGSVEAVQAWQRTIPKSRLEVLPGDSYHVAASDPDACAVLVRDFFEPLRGQLSFN
jgi:3-oxoadipate enol-lactonase